MIKKALAFLLLLAAGFAILYVATGDETMATFGVSGQELSKETRPEPETPGVRVPLGDKLQGVGEDVTATYSGGIIFKESRKVTRPDGTVQKLPLYTLDAEECHPRPDEIWELRGVTVIFFEVHGPRGRPQVVEAGRLRASRAHVEIGHDEEGRRSIAKDKDIELFDAVLDTGAASRVKNLRLFSERARVRATDAALEIRSATPEQEFELEIRDPGGPAKLTGLGLRARFPLREEGATQTSDPVFIRVSQQPLLVHRGANGETRLSASGPLTYVEDPVTGLAEITAVDEVRIESIAALAGSAASSSPQQPLVAYGDQLRATLRRHRESGPADRTEMRWHSMHLVGSPAGLRGQDMKLTCDEVDVTPNLEGEPWLFTARGQPRLSNELEEGVMRFTAAERIHLVRLPTHLEPWLSGRGWSQRTSHPQLQQLLIFCGDSSLTLPHDGGELTLRARRGLRVLRGAQNRGPMTVVGHGSVELRTRDAKSPLSVTGSQGFLLHTDARGQDLRLGPRSPDAGHRFEVETAELVVRGSGSCRLFRPTSTDRPGQIRLSSPASDLELTMRASNGALRQVAELTANFDDKGVHRLDARGPSCQVLWHDEQGQIEGTATHIWSTDPATYFLAGAPAVVVEGGGRTLEGHRIRIVRISAKHTLLEAEQNAHLVARELPGSKGPRKTLGLDLSADRIRYIPFLVPPSAWLPLTSLRGPHLIAQGNVVVQHLDENGTPISRAHGDMMALALADEPTGRLLGAPASVTRRDAAGQQVSGEAAEIFLGGGGQISLLRTEGRWPVLLVGNRQGQLARFGSADGVTRVVCDGSIDADASRILFRGPVEARSIDRNGHIEAEGFHLDAQRMVMERNAKTGEIERVHALDGAELRWRGIEANAEQLTLDLVSHLCTAIDRSGDARVRFPSGVWGQCAHAEFNYLTYEGTAWNVHVAGGRAAR